MAEQSSVIELIFRGIDQASEVASSTAQNIGDAFSDLGGKTQSIAAPFADLANQLLAAEAAALAMGLALTAAALDAAGAFDDGFKEITTLIDQPKDSLEGLRQEILAYAATSTASMAEVNGAFYNAISLGVDYTASVQAVSAAEKLAVAGKADLNITLQAMLGTMNAYGAGMDDAGRYSDIFFNTVKAGKTTIPELAASISGVTGTAALGKVPFEEIAAAIATLTSQGAPTSAAITQINATMSAIIKPTGEAAKLAESLGIEFNATALASKGLGGVILDVAAKTGGAADKMAVLYGGTEALKGAVGVAAQNGEKFNETLTMMKEKLGATEEAFNKIKDSTVTMANAVQIALVAFGLPMLESLDGTQEALGKLALAFIDVANSGGLKPLQDLINDNLGGITETIEAIAENLPAAFEQLDWSGLIDSLTGLQSEVGDVFKAFFGEIDLTTVDGLASALQTVMNTFETLTRIVTGIVGEFKPFAAAIGETVRSFNELDDASKVDFGSTLGGMKLLVDAGTGLGLVLIAIGRAGIDMGSALDVVFGSVKIAVNALQLGFETITWSITKIAQTALEASVAVYKLNPFGDNAAKIADAEARIKTLQGTADVITESMTRNAAELREGWGLEGKIKDEDTPWGNQDKLNEDKAKLADVELKIAAVTANLDRNAQEFDAGAAAIGETNDQFDGLRSTLDATEAGLKKLGGAAKGAGQDFSELSGEIAATVQDVERTLKDLETIDIKLPKLEPLEPPDLDFEFSTEDLGIGNPFEAATDGLDAFREAADGFGMDGFSDRVKSAREAAEAEGQRIQSALEQALTGGNAGGYKFQLFGADGIPKITANAETLKNSFQQLDGTIRKTADGYPYVEANARLAGTAMTLLADGTIVAGEAVEQAGRYFHQLGPSAFAASKEMSALEKAQKALGDAFGKGGADVGKITGALNEYMGALGQSGKLTTDQFINLTKVVNDYKTKMEEIASNERIKNIEATVRLKTAELEADVKRVQATFASLDTTINSTGELLASLFDNLVATKDRDKLDIIQEQIDLENQRRQEALDLQKELAEAEIERIKAQTAALNRGDALITIQADGLEPELEAFMWKILSKIRARANAEFADYLLGLGVG